MDELRFFLELSLKGKTVVLVVIAFLSVSQAFIYRLKWIVAVPFFLLLHVCFIVFQVYFGMYSIRIHLFFLIPATIFSFFLYAILPGRKFKISNKNRDPWKVILPVRNGKPVVLENIKRGLAVFGSAGAGKTESVFVPIIKNAVECGLTGINYDYKDGEITEIVNAFYKGTGINTYNIIPHRPELSHRINPVYPYYIDSPEMVNELVAILFKNMRKDSRERGFFQDVPESVLAGTIWRLKCDYPEYCTIPHAIAVCITKDPKELAGFLGKNRQSRIIASPFFDSLGAADQMAGVKATLSNDLRKFAFPSIFYVLSEHELDLHINNPETPAMLNLINSPDKELTQSPFLALIFTTTIKLMQKRGMLPAYLLMDEAATLNLPSFSRIPATMRSYNIATVYSLQDKVLGNEQYGDITTRAILSNLSYQIIGKTNDPESVRYYKQIVEEIEKKQISKSYGTGLIPKGETRKTESIRDVAKYKNQDFFGLKTGEFIVFSDGKDRKVNFDLLKYERLSLKVRHHVTQDDLDKNFNQILKIARSIQ